VVSFMANQTFLVWILSLLLMMLVLPIRCAVPETECLISEIKS
jgi:hypothetical protein